MQYHVAPLREMEMCRMIIQVTASLWKDQTLHFGALIGNSALKCSHQYAIGMQAGFLILSVYVVLFHQVRIVEPIFIAK